MLAAVAGEMHTCAMKNIMMAWELGGGLGHVANRFAVHETLRARGHRVALAWRDLRTLFRLRPDMRGPVFAAPNPPGLSLAPQRTMLSFADILWHDAGLHEAAVCAAVITAWRSLLIEFRCDLLLADAAPMATVAARSMGIPVLRHGISFLHPPAVAPFPVFRDWERHDANHLPLVEARALEHVNAALKPHAGATFETLAQACADAPLLLESLPEVDVYGPRAIECCLPNVAHGHHDAPQWSSQDGPRIFCYLKHDYPWLDRLFGALNRAPAQTCAFIDGAAPKLPAGAPIRLHHAPVDTRSAIAQSDLIICAAGNGMINESLLAGKPLLLLPMQAEQYLNARQVQRLGAGLTVTPPIDKPEFLTPLRRLLSEPAFAEAAQSIATRHRDLAQQNGAERFADVVDAMLG
jgi:UDP:flavonoid glycosyltransferase YjiC (YdhE family)